MNTKFTILNKLKIPPLIFFFPVILGLIIDIYFNRIEAKNPFFIYLGTIILILGILIMILALKEFYVNQESPAPFISTKNIITTGIFRFTRNPMYFSFFVSTLGVSIILFSLGILVGSIIGIILIHKLVVIFEEKKLISIEGYENYKNKTRRWI
jgi:protein-S-isoprenylcysteine O-methyltransferase Ste14